MDKTKIYKRHLADFQWAYPMVRLLGWVDGLRDTCREPDIEVSHPGQSSLHRGQFLYPLPRSEEKSWTSGLAVCYDVMWKLSSLSTGARETSMIHAGPEDALRTKQPLLYS